MDRLLLGIRYVQEPLIVAGEIVAFLSVSQLLHESQAVGMAQGVVITLSAGHVSLWVARVARLIQYRLWRQRWLRTSAENN
jgi:hypothetical protein